MNTTLEQFKKLPLEKKFTFLLAKKLEKVDLKPELDSLSKEELLLFKEWVGKKKEGAVEQTWKEKQAKRAAKAAKADDAEEEVIFNTGE